MLCPFCVRNISNGADTCPYDDCKKELPLLYKKHYPRGWFSKKPLIMSAVGFRGHGKTVYLASLLHVLDTALTKVWDRFYRQGLEMETIKTVKNNIQMLETGILPESTRSNFPHPSIHLLSKIPGYGDRQFVAYDTSGEVFEEDVYIEKYARFIAHSKVVLFLISLVDLDEPLANNIHRLLEIYTLGMQKLQADTRKQHLVVVYTKADLLLQTFLTRETRPELVNYLEGDPNSTMRDLNRYYQEMELVSSQLAAFTNNDLGARNFINLAADSFQTVSYCAISALGQKPVDGKLSAAMQPRRVVDPLLWALKKS